MPALLTTVAVALVAALVLGVIASWLRLSPIVGYLLAGIAIGPHSPGFAADAVVASDLAEIGVALLMFGVGLHFVPRDLAALRSIAVPGAIVQVAVASGLGLAIGVAWGWGPGAGLLLGLAVSVASTVVVTRGLEANGLLAGAGGRTAMAWLIVEDLLTVVVLVLLPGLSGSLGGLADAGAGAPVRALVVTVLKIALLASLVLVLGRRAIPWMLNRVAGTRSSELFTLCVLGLALGLACVASWTTGVSLALGAFLAGMTVGQSDLSHRAAADSMPLRDAFAVLYFVSIGMLFEPRVLLHEPILLAATLGIVLVAKPLTALVVVLVLGYPSRVALTIAAALAQVGEFSFVLAHVGLDLDLLPKEGLDVVLACALLSISINPFLFRAIEPLEKRLHGWAPSARLLARLASRAEDAEARPPVTAGHVVVCGSGRVGAIVGRVLQRQGWPLVIVESDHARARHLDERGFRVIEGDAASPKALEAAGIEHAGLLVIAFTDASSARIAIARARQIRPNLPIVVRTAGRLEREHLEAMPGVHPVVGEVEIASEVVRLALRAAGAGTAESETTVSALRFTDPNDVDGTGSSTVELVVAPGSAADGQRVADLALVAGASVVAVRRGPDEIVVRGDTRLQAHDHVRAAVDRSGRACIEALVGAPSSTT